MERAKRRFNKRLRRQKRKRGKSPNLNPWNGYHPDMVINVANDLARVAKNVETAIINLAVVEAGKATTKQTFRGKLKRLVAYSVGLLTGKAKQVEKQATLLGQQTAKATLPKGAKKLMDQAPRAPLSLDRGKTVRAPKALHEAIKQTAPTLMGSGSRLFDEVVKRFAKEPPRSDAHRKRMSQEILDDFHKRGLTGFIDRAGRRWKLDTYVEMATRTAANNLAQEAHLKTLVEAGYDVVRVNIMPNCAPQCQPFQGRLLSITGATKGTYHGEPIVATVSEAIARGYRHPNCRHSAKLWLPGVPFVDPDSVNPGDYKATQEQRRLEREIRRAKTRLETAQTDARRKQERAKIRRLQADMRKLVEVKPIVRDRNREQVGTPR